MIFSGVKIEIVTGLPPKPLPNRFYLLETLAYTALYLSDSNSNLVLLGSSLPNYLGAVLLTGNQSVNGIKIFSESPIVPTPSSDYQTSTKKYVDDSIVTISSENFLIGEFTDDIVSDSIATAEYVCTLGANLLTNIGDKIEAFFCGTFTTSGDDKQLAVLFGGAAIFDTGLKTAGDGDWEIVIRLIKDSVDSIKSSGRFNNGTDVEMDYVELSSLDFSVAIDLTLEITSDVDTENTAKFGYVKFIHAFNPPPPDTDAPSVPTGLTLTVLGTDAIQADWDASTD